MSDHTFLDRYRHDVAQQYATGVTTEHSFRGMLATLLGDLLPQYDVVNDIQHYENLIAVLSATHDTMLALDQ